MSAGKLLIVDDDAEVSGALRSSLERHGYLCTLAATVAEALAALERDAFDVVISEVRMKGVDGLELLDRVTKTSPSLPVVLITGTSAVTAKSAVAEAVSAIKRGAYDYLTKPCDIDKLRAIVFRAIGDRRPLADDAATMRPAAAQFQDATLVGDSPRMHALLEAVELVAASGAPALLVGETGAGKELVARTIHAKSPRRGRPFVPVNTAAIPIDLLEAELLGHVRGAFTGAAQARRGLLSEADGGTLFLDEIGDMPLILQAKLLRVLQFGDVRPVGSDRSHRVDVRFIAATHRDLPTLVREGRFREDLYFRLNVLPVVVPPLRERREDVPMLAIQFLAEAKRRVPTSPVRGIGPEAMRLLLEASWPGNVRELQSTMERLVVFGRDEIIGPAALSGSVAPVSGIALSRPAAPYPGVVPWAASRLESWTLEQVTDAHTEWVLARNSGDHKRVAEILGVNLSTLYRWRAKQRRKNGVVIRVAHDAGKGREGPCEGGQAPVSEAGTDRSMVRPMARTG